MGILKVTVVCANNLVAKDEGGLFSRPSSDPYVIVRVGMTQYKTTTKYKNLNPSYNETFIFSNIYDPSREIVSFEVYDYDRASKDDFIGSVSLPLSTFIKGKLQRYVLNLGSSKYSNAGTIVVECLAEDFGIPQTGQPMQTNVTCQPQQQQQPMMQQQYPMQQQPQQMYPPIYQQPTMHQQQPYYQQPPMMPQCQPFQQMPQQQQHSMGYIQQTYIPGQQQQYPPYFQQYPPPPA
ncbi:hypothetical protein ABK040_001631 [Willaertia magna]